VPIAGVAGLAGAYNSIVLAGFCLTGYATYRLALDVLDDVLDRDVSAARMLGHESEVSGLSRRCAAFVAGVTFAFSSYRFAHLFAVAARSRSSRRWSIVLAVYAALALGPVLRVAGYQVPGLSWLMPYRLLMRLPYGNIPRVPARLVSMVSLSLSVLAALGAHRVLKGNRARILLLTSLVSALAIGENLVFPVPVQAVVAPVFFERLAADHVRGGVLELPIPDDPTIFPQRMLWQLSTVNLCLAATCRGGSRRFCSRPCLALRN